MINPLCLSELAPKETNTGNLADDATACVGVDFRGNDHFGASHFCEHGGFGVVAMRISGGWCGAVLLVDQAEEPGCGASGWLEVARDWRGDWIALVVFVRRGKGGKCIHRIGGAGDFIFVYGHDRTADDGAAASHGGNFFGTDCVGRDFIDCRGGDTSCAGLGIGVVERFIGGDIYGNESESGSGRGRSDGHGGMGDGRSGGGECAEYSPSGRGELAGTVGYECYGLVVDRVISGGLHRIRTGVDQSFAALGKCLFVQSYRKF